MGRGRLALVVLMAPVLVGCSSVRSLFGPDLGDLDSNEDLSGYTATVSYEDSPYQDSLPDVCELVPASFFTGLGLQAPGDSGSLATGSLLSVCGATYPKPFDPTGWRLSVGIFVDPITAFISNPKLRVVKQNIRVGPHTATMFLDPVAPLSCRLMWGTFYGTAGVTVNLNDGNTTDPCAHVFEYARGVYDFLPKRPVQMRPPNGR